jgi:site-specific recombinase XerD
MGDYALELVDGNLRAPRPDPTIWISSAHGVQRLVRLDVKHAGGISTEPAALSLEAQRRRLQLEVLLAKSPNTLRAYQTDLRDFQAYCQARGLTDLPTEAQTIAGYLFELVRRGHKPSTILRRRASVSMVYRLAGRRIPDVGDTTSRLLLQILRGRLDSAAKKAALDIDTLRRLLQATPPRTAAGARDRAILLLGVAGGLGPSEVVALDAGSIYVTDQRLWVMVPSTRTDLTQFGRWVAIPRGEHPETCPVRTIQAWYAISGIRSGSLFRPIDRHGRVGATRLSARGVAPVIKRAAQRAGLDPALFAGHSLRAGLITSAAMGGAPERVILAQTGLRSLSSLRRNMRRGSRSDRNAATYLGL